jgi:hypothetical protein
MTAVAVAKYGDAFIPNLDYLEPGLGTVPGCDLRDPRYRDPDAEWRLRWFEWRRRVDVLRTQMWVACATDERTRGVQSQICDEDWAYFLTMFTFTYDPRPRDGEGIDKPFILFAIQANKVQEIQRIGGLPGKIDIFDSKSRGFGWTDTYTGAALAAWRCTNWSMHFVSFKEDKVYKRNDRGTIFGKIEYKLQMLPQFLIPAGFDIEENMLRLNIYNPDTGASITGESTTTKTLRGDRKTFVVYDESAFIEKFQDVYETGAGTSDKRFCLSTESYEEGEDWELLWKTEKDPTKGGNPERVWEIDWPYSPYQDTTWYAIEKNRFKTRPLVFAREYERNAELAEAGVMYPGARDWQGIPEHHDPTKVLMVGIDPGNAQDTGISWGQPRYLPDGRKGILWLGSYKRNLVPVAFYAHLLTGIPPEPGDVCWPMWENGGFSARDKRLMAFFGERLASEHNRQEWVYYTMDPAGAQNHAQPGSSWFDLFYDATSDLLVRQWTATGQKGPKPKGVAPDYQVLQSTGNLIVDRVLTTQHFLSASEFSNADPELWRAEDVQTALRRSKYSEATPRTVSEPKPIHGDESHLRTSAEFISYGLYMGLEAPPKRIAKQMLSRLRDQDKEAA